MMVCTVSLYYSIRLRVFQGEWNVLKVPVTVVHWKMHRMLHIHSKMFCFKAQTAWFFFIFVKLK